MPAVARLVGFLSLLVKKYIKSDFVAQKDINITPFTGVIKPMKEVVKTFTNWNDFYLYLKKNRWSMGLRKEFTMIPFSSVTDSISYPKSKQKQSLLIQKYMII